MVTISQILSLEYYMDLGKEDYYMAGGEPHGIWLCAGATELGLSGEVFRDDLQNLMNGVDWKGRHLCENVGAKDRRTGWDICFSPPKSVSVAFARASYDTRKEIKNAHLQAVKSAIEHMEKYAAVCRRGHNGEHRESVAGLVVAAFEHSTSREMDPQLHTHTLVLNASLRSDQSWGSLDSRNLYLWRRSADAIYTTALASKLRELGFSLEMNEKYSSFEIKGIPDELCFHFSKRTQQVKAGLLTRGLTNSSSRSGALVTLGTRKKKTIVDRGELLARWGEEMDEFGYSETCFEQALQRQRSNEEYLFEDMELPPLEVDALLLLMTDSKAIFEKRTLFEKAAQLALANGLSIKVADRVANLAIRCTEIVSLGRDHRYSPLFTTKKQLAAERNLVADAVYLRSSSGFGLQLRDVESSITSLSITLSEEQAEAVIGACQSHHFDILQGSAGAGKSTTMKCVNSAYERAGYKVLGAAVAKSAADNLAREAGMQTCTIAKLLSDMDRGRAVLSRKTVLIIDEAGQVSTSQLSALAKYARQNGAKLILTGDDKQLDAIEHGGMLKYLSRPDILGSSRIDTIRRQRTPWARQAVAHLRDGQAAEALKSFQERGLLSFCDNQDAAQVALVGKWKHFNDSNPNKSCLILAQKWRDVESLSNLIREEHRAKGRLNSRGIKFTCIVGNHEQELEFSKGDRVRFTHNDYRLGLTNGVLGELVNMENFENGDVRFVVKDDDGVNRSFLRSEYCDSEDRLQLVHAYASTVYASQGLTVDETFILHDVQMGRGAAYVAGSRHRDNCHWFFNVKSIDDLVSLEESSDRLALISKLLSEDKRQKTALELYSNRIGESTLEQRSLEIA